GARRLDGEAHLDVGDAETVAGKPFRTAQLRFQKIQVRLELRLDETVAELVSNAARYRAHEERHLGVADARDHQTEQKRLHQRACGVVQPRALAAALGAGSR